MIKALINNEWESIPKEILQLGSETFAYETGLYETFRTLDHRPVFLEPHLDRLFKSAQMTGLKIYFSRTDILEMINQVISNFHDPNQRVRILAVPGNLIVYTSSLNLDPKIYEGVPVITVNAIRQTPNVKTTNYQVCLNAWKQSQNLGCFEAILTDENGNIYEGSRSNVFWIKEGRLFTRFDDVLPGITRQKISKNSPISVLDGELNQDDLQSIYELFLTNSGSGIIPVTTINSQAIGDGSVGKITSQLIAQYNKWMLEDIKG